MTELYREMRNSVNLILHKKGIEKAVPGN
jgi:hypothetical protein